MTEDALFDAAPLAGPAWPEPTLRRWQPLRLGLVELYRYDSEEFWFHDGHLLLRGNNGTGKSKVLSLTLPFLFDASLRSSRIEPDGDAGKKMAWNLLLGGAYDRRTGYAWIEFGRVAEDGTPRYITLGAGLSAKAALAAVEAWYFVVEEAAAARMGRELWLVNPQRVVLSREKLRETLRDTLSGHGQVYESAQAYRRAVDERLFGLGAQRYDALIDTLIQLRQPQLSRRPDEAALSAALTESLPPLATELLADVADAMAQLEEDRRQLESFEQLHRAVTRFEQRYRVYAGMQGRRQARLLRQAQTEFDNASRERQTAQVRAEQAQAAERQAVKQELAAQTTLLRQRATLETLQADPRNQDANRLDNAKRDAQQRGRAAQDFLQAQQAGAQTLLQEDGRLAARQQAAGTAQQALQRERDNSHTVAQAAGIAAAWTVQPLLALAPEAMVHTTDAELGRMADALRLPVQERREHVAVVRRRKAQHDEARRELVQRAQWRGQQEEAAEGAAARRTEADAAVEQVGQDLVQAWADHLASLAVLRLDGVADLDTLQAALADWVPTLQGEDPARQALQQALQQANLRLATQQAALAQQQAALKATQDALQTERAGLQRGVDPLPPAPATRGAGTRSGRPGAPWWQLVDFQPQVSAAEAAGLEAALQAAGLLDAWVTPEGVLLGGPGDAWHDVQLVPRAPATAPAPAPAAAPTLADVLCAAPPVGCAVSAAVITALLRGVAIGAADPAQTESWVSPQGRFRVAGLSGAWHKA